MTKWITLNFPEEQNPINTLVSFNLYDYFYGVSTTVSSLYVWKNQLMKETLGLYVLYDTDFQSVSYSALFSTQHLMTYCISVSKPSGNIWFSERKPLLKKGNCRPSNDHKGLPPYHYPPVFKYKTIQINKVARPRWIYVDLTSLTTIQGLNLYISVKIILSYKCMHN